MNKTEAEDANHKIVHEWYQDFDLSFGGIPLGDVIEYDLLRVLGALWKKVLDVPAAQLPDGHLPNA